MLRRAARQLNPVWAYREENARKMHPGSLKDQQWGWVYAPTAAALYSVAWQLALVAAALGVMLALAGSGLDSPWGGVLIGCVFATFCLLFAGSLAHTPLLIEAARRRSWRLILSGFVGYTVLLRVVDYAFGPRPATHPHPRFAPGQFSLRSDIARP